MGMNYYLMRKERYSEESPFPVCLGCTHSGETEVRKLSNGWMWDDTYYPTLEELNENYCQKIHIDKDSSIYVAFDKVHPKNEDLSPKRREDYAYGTWRVSLLSFLAAIEKYSPKINLDGDKAQINLAYDQYAGEPMNYHNGHVTTRPFPEVQTPRYYERFSHKPAQYYVIHGEKILASFVELEIAQEYIKNYLTGNLRLENPKPLPVHDDEVERYEDSSGISVSLKQYKEEL